MKTAKILNVRQFAAVSSLCLRVPVFKIRFGCGRNAGPRSTVEPSWRTLQPNAGLTDIMNMMDGTASTQIQRAQPSETSSPALTRRQLLKRLAGGAAVAAAVGYYANRVEPFWPKFPEVPITLKGLPGAFANFRIAQLTDLHTGRVPLDYLRDVVDRVKQIKPDLVAVTGDLVHHDPQMIQPVTRLLSGFACPVLVSFGNHDYAPLRGDDDPYDPELADKLQVALTAGGCQVLRNAALPISRDGQTIWMVGLDDLWFGDFNPRLAFETVPARDGDCPVAQSRYRRKARPAASRSNSFRPHARRTNPPAVLRRSAAECCPAAVRHGAFSAAAQPAVCKHWRGVYPVREVQLPAGGAGV